MALATSLTALAALVIYVFDRYPEQTLGRRELMEMVRNVVDGISFDNDGMPVSVKLPEHEDWFFRVASTELKYRILDEHGHILLVSDRGKSEGPWLTDDFSRDTSKIAHVTIGGRRFSMATQRIVRGESVYYVQTATSERFTEALVSLKVKPIPGIVRTILLVAIVTFGLALPFTIRRVLKPLRDASDAAAQITPRNLKTRLSARGIPSEIKPLINAFNEALERLENGFTVQQQFLATAAHELQTPLTLIRGQIELQPEIREKHLLFREIDLMSRQVRQLLHLAEVSDAQNFDFGEVNTADVAHEVIGYLARKADDKQVSLRIEERVALPAIWADKGALFILLKNIVENAIHASPANGIVLLRIDAASIGISDEGPGIREDHLPFLFKRFWRAPDATHEGAGLGLAICKEIALAHGWRLTVSAFSPGTGFTVWL
ncbi:sensor histidine kinase [Paraburkholderia kururiensis]|uniref:sensor histidine kinase n=1 Tax=Paraburkholderia TaxID=1822464 RepID=UPI003BA3E040